MDTMKTPRAWHHEIEVLCAQNVDTILGSVVKAPANNKSKNWEGLRDTSSSQSWSLLEKESSLGPLKIWRFASHETPILKLEIMIDIYEWSPSVIQQQKRACGVESAHKIS